MFARLARWLSGRRDAAVSPAAPSPQPVAEEPTRPPKPRLVHVAPETPRKRRRRREPGQLPPDVHARRLLHWCQTEGGATGDILAADLLEIYHEQCSYDLLEPLHWQAVAVELRRLLGGRKTYRWMGEPNRSPRLRYYHIPELPPGADARFLEFHEWMQRDSAPVRLRRAA